jgi:hypothetical protein
VTLGPDWTPLVRVGLELAPFIEREIFGVVLGGTRLTIKPEHVAGVGLLEYDITEAKLELAKCVDALHAAYARKDNRRAQKLRRQEFRLETWLVEAHRDLLALAEPRPIREGRDLEPTVDAFQQETDSTCSDLSTGG